MRQVFLTALSDRTGDFENEDALPVSERLIPELELHFLPVQKEDQILFSIPSAQAAEFLSQFYTRYELSQPQRRVWRRLEHVLRTWPSEQKAEFAVAEVSAHRSRRKAKKS